MLKPTASFRMSKQTKRTLALGTFRSNEERNLWKKAMIQAQLYSELAPKREKKPRPGQIVQNDSETE